MWSATRQALAMMVSVGLAPVPVGNGPPSTTKRLSTSCAAAPSVQHRGVPGRCPSASVPCWCEQLPVTAVDVNLVHRRGAGRLEDLGVAVDQEPAHGQIVLVRLQRDPGDRQTPGVSRPVVEFDAVVVLRHVVHHHGDRHAVVEVITIDLSWPRLPRPGDRAGAS